MIDKIEDSLKGCYKGLYDEVVTEDIYRLNDVSDKVSINDPNEIHTKGHKRNFDFIPDLIIDCGANIGIFSRYARTLFPKALIVSIEPDPENSKVFKQFTNDSNLVLIEKAIGNGKLYHGLTAANGSGETYLSESIGFPIKEMDTDERMEISDIETIKLSEVIKNYSKEGDKIIVKIDCEGAENSILLDEYEMNELRKVDYVCAEIHFYALTGIGWQEVKDKTMDALKSLELTHKCELDNVNFWATKF